MTDLRAIASAMGGEVRGNTVAFPTPGHIKRDRGTVATIAPGAPDGIVVHSFNGGDPLATKDVMRAKGVLPERERTGGGSRDVAAWEYQDRDGVTLYRKVRMALASGGKSYRLERPDGHGGWAKGTGGVERVPYRLPDLLAADPAAPVFMAEGEKQADKLASWGLVATSSKDWPRRYSETLAGRTVVILPDNDAEGARIAAETRGKVETAGARAFLVELPGLPSKGDIMDWSGDVDALNALADATINPPAKKLLPMLDLAAWEGMNTPPREWVLNEWIPARQATYLTGAGSAGKSLLSQQLCTCIAAGLPFMGLETRQAPAIYVTCEDDPDELHRRQKAICEALGVRLSDLAGKLHVVSLVGAIGNELATFDANGRMIVAEAFRTVRETALAIGAGFIVLDNVAHLFAGNENIRNQVAAFCGLLNQLAHDTGGAVLFLGHPNKAGDRFSGSPAWENQVRSRLFLETPKDDAGAALDADARVLSKGKANYSQNGAQVAFRWHRGAFVRENDLPADAYAETAANAAANAENFTFLRCLAERTKQSRAVSDRRSPTYAPTVFAAMPEAKRTTKAQLERAMERLFRLGRIERAVIGRDTGKGRDIVGLRETPPNGAPERFPNTVPERLLTPAPNAPTHTLYLRYIGRGLRCRRALL